jgi:hypothetical protein
MPDQIDFTEANPFANKHSKDFKGVTDLRIFKFRFPELEEESWRSVLCSPAYHAGIAVHISCEVIDRC